MTNRLLSIEYLKFVELAMAERQSLYGLVSHPIRTEVGDGREGAGDCDLRRQWEVCWESMLVAGVKAVLLRMSLAALVPRRCQRGLNSSRIIKRLHRRNFAATCEQTRLVTAGDLKRRT